MIFTSAWKPTARQTLPSSLPKMASTPRYLIMELQSSPVHIDIRKGKQGLGMNRWWNDARLYKEWKLRKYREKTGKLRLYEIEYGKKEPPSTFTTNPKERLTLNAVYIQKRGLSFSQLEPTSQDKLKNNSSSSIQIFASTFSGSLIDLITQLGPQPKEVTDQLSLSIFWWTVRMNLPLQITTRLLYNIWRLLIKTSRNMA